MERKKPATFDEAVKRLREKEANCNQDCRHCQEIDDLLSLS